MADTSTPQYVQQRELQQAVIVTPVEMSNPTDEDDVNAPFLMNEAMIEGNHNDPEISVQKTAFNLNNPNVRLTLWFIVYMIFTTASIQTGTSWYIYNKNDRPEEDEDDTRYYSLYISSNSILWWASVIILCSLYCTCCKIKCNVFSAILFIIGGIMQAVTIGDGISIDCVEHPYRETSKADIGYCKVSNIAAWTFIICFSFYLAADIVYHIGNNIRTRILIKALIVGVEQFLEFLVQQYILGKLSDDNDTKKYVYNTKASCSFSIFFWCLVLIIIIVMGYGKNSQRKLNIWVRRIIAWFLIAGVGGTLLVSFSYLDFSDNVSLVRSYSYYIPAAVLLIYDTQYL